MFEPQRFGRYLLIQKLATGGMAEIFLAKLSGAAGFEKEIVLKKILPQWSSDHDFISMLIDEAKIVVQLNHPAIVQVYELAREGETYYIAMEYIHGVDLRKVISQLATLKKKIPLDVALMMMTEVLEGLAYAHSKKNSQGVPMEIIHRDISPQNILVSFDGHVKITDFGIARATSRNHETRVGVLKGKFAYMSPEQANQEVLDARSDLYAAAIVFYELLTGERLFHKGSDIDTLDRVRRGDIHFSESAEKIMPEQLKEILLKALSKQVEGRYWNASDFREDLLKFSRKFRKNLRREKLADFVQKLFKEEVRADVVEETQVRTPATRLMPEDTKTAGEREILVQGHLEKFLPKNSRKIELNQMKVLVIASLIFMLGFYFFFGRSQNTGEKIEPLKTSTPVVKSMEPRTPNPPEVKPPQRPSISEAQVMGAVLQEPVTRIEKGEKEKKMMTARSQVEVGFVSVQAIPWGYVTIDGGGRRWETPARKLSLKPGKHRVEVFYEPEGVRVSENIEVVSSEEVVCVASFKGGKEGKQIQCGH